MLVGHGAGGGGTARDVGGPGAQQGPIRPMGPTGAELRHRTALRRPDDAVGLGGDQALVVEAEEHEGLDKLCLDGRRAHRQNGLAWEDGRPLRNGPNIAGKGKSAQIFQNSSEKQPFDRRYAMSSSSKHRFSIYSTTWARPAAMAKPPRSGTER